MRALRRRRRGLCCEAVVNKASLNSVALSHRWVAYPVGYAHAGHMLLRKIGGNMRDAL